MAVALAGTPTIGTDANGPATLTWSFTNSDAGNLMIVAAGAASTTDGITVTSVTYGGVGTGWSQWATTNEAVWAAMHGWSKNGSLATGANDVVITFLATGDGQRGGIAAAFSGVHATTPLGTPVTKGNRTDDPINIVITDSVAGDMVYGAICTDSATITENHTLILEAENVGSDTSFGAQRFDGGGSVTMEWDVAAANGGALVGVAIKAAAAGGGAALPPFIIGDLSGIGSPGRLFKDQLQ